MAKAFDAAKIPLFSMGFLQGGEVCTVGEQKLIVAKCAARLNHN
jgi:hypothetical protein